MLDWQRIIVGDAFVLDSRDNNLYRDIFLFVPFLLSSIMAVSGLFAAKPNFINIGKCGLLSLLAVAPVRERLVIVGPGWALFPWRAEFYLSSNTTS